MLAASSLLKRSSCAVWLTSSLRASSAKASFDVEDFEQFVVVQSETALRHLANRYPYDDYASDQVSLRGNSEEIRQALQLELQARLRIAGVEVLRARSTR